MINTKSETTYISERRLKPRCICNYPARLTGLDENRKKIEEDGRAVNLSRSGIFILLNREIPTGSPLLIRVALPTGFLNLGTSKLALHGTVVRGSAVSESTYGIGVKIDEYRFV